MFHYSYPKKIDFSTKGGKSNEEPNPDLNFDPVVRFLAAAIHGTGVRIGA